MTRKILDFIKSPSGKFMLFFLAVIIFAMVFSYYKSLPAKEKDNPSSFNDAIDIDREYARFRDEYEQMHSAVNQPIKTQLEKTVETQEKENQQLEEKLVLMEKVLAEEKARNKILQVQLPAVTSDPKEVKKAEADSFSLSPVSLYTAKAIKQKAETAPLENYAPYGRLIKCQLVNTVDSSSFDTPIIGLVTENVWHQGKIIIPAGTEVHGTAASLTQRNRIAAEKNWILVWRTKSPENGFELPLSALALDYSQDIDTGSYSITDGSAGLRGDIIETDEYSKLKLYAALFLKGAASGVSELLLTEAESKNENTYINSDTEEKSDSNQDVQNQIKVGIAKGAEQAIELYTNQMLDAISRDGVFVRVPAGRFYYLYVTQTINKNKAYPGASSNVAPPEADSLNSNPQTSVDEAQQMLLSLTRQRLQKENQNKEETQNDQ